MSQEIILIDFAGKWCAGCDRMAEQIAKEDGYTDEDFDNCSVRTTCGNWYHHDDCFSDSH